MTGFSHGHTKLNNPCYAAKRKFLFLDLAMTRSMRTDGPGHWWPGGGMGHSLPWLESFGIATWQIDKHWIMRLVNHYDPAQYTSST